MILVRRREEVQVAEFAIKNNPEEEGNVENVLINNNEELSENDKKLK